MTILTTLAFSDLYKYNLRFLSRKKNNNPCMEDKQKITTQLWAVGGGGGGGTKGESGQQVTHIGLVRTTEQMQHFLH